MTNPRASHLATRVCRLSFARVARGLASIASAVSAIFVMACASHPEQQAPVVLISREPADDRIDKPSPASTEESKPKSFMLEWEKDERSARERAKREQLPLLVVLGADWSSASLAMKREVFSDPRVLFRSTSIVALWIDLTNEDDPNAELLASRYSVTAIPTLIVFDADGVEVARTSGLASVEEVLSAIRKGEGRH